MRACYGTLASVIVLLILLAPAGEGMAAPAGGDDEGRAPGGGAAALAEAFRRAAERASPSVVTIETYSGPRETIQWARRVARINTSDDGDELESRNVTSARNGVGTGIIFDARGYILTCNHVIDEAEMAFVTLADGRRFEGIKILRDPFSDVAVVQIEGAGPLPAAELSKGDQLEVGDWVVTIGNPYGLGISLTAGVVSAKNRQMRHIPYVGLIQTDAATNPGNSGGALVDLEGRVVGICEGGYGVVEGFQGIGFAIPIDVVEGAANELIANGKVHSPFLGVSTEAIPGDIARHLNLNNPGGVIVSDVAPRSPAALAGVQVGDVLTHVNGFAVSDHLGFFRLVDDTPEGESISLTALRNSKSIAIEFVPSALPLTPLRSQEKSDVAREEPLGFMDEELGLAVDVFTAGMARELGYEGPVDGLIVTFVEKQSIAAKQDICAGMSIVRVDGDLMEDVDDYRAAIKTRDLAKGTLLLLGSPHQKHFVLCRD